jgi:hypothetical protein
MTSYNFGLPFRSGQALTTGFATLVFVTSIAKQSRANGNVSLGHSPTTNVGNPRFVSRNRPKSRTKTMEKVRIFTQGEIEGISRILGDTESGLLDRKLVIF